ncbi:hypothetical protein FRC07_002518 [Ceratobasidium sp. 392]|nr:hypothetical protein FRC07_002518 [Ceratobasidium sp. 392]
MQTARKPAAARPARAAGRYWKGKAPKGAEASALSDSDSDAGQEEGVEGEEQEIGEDEFELAVKDEADGATAVKKSVAKMSVALRDVDVRDGKVYVGGQEAEESEESEEDEEEEKPKIPGAESGSSEYESSSEEESEEELPKPQFRPVFVPKRARETIKKMEAESEFSEEAMQRREIEAAERKKASHDLVAESIKRELAEKETAENIPDVDDADNLDPAAEFEAWRARELARLARDADAAQAREEERLERERRAALPEEVRLKEDQERADKSRADKPKGQQKFLQKYWHKGAFHQDAEVLKRHDFTEATESTIDASALPAVMQVKNFGKRGQTKYTHLRDQDTTVKLGEFGAAGIGKAPRPAGAVGAQEGCFNCGGPHLKRGKFAVLSNGIVPTRLNKRARMRHLVPATHPLQKLGEQGGLQTPPTTEGDRVRVGKIEMMVVDEWTTSPGEQMTLAEIEIATETGIDTGDQTTGTHLDETGLQVVLSTETTTEGEIIHLADETTADGRSGGAMTEIGTIGVGDHAPESTAASTRRLAGMIVKVAVIGSGLAGLTAAYLLTKSTSEGSDVEFDIHIFEKSSVLGMDAESLTVRVSGSSGREKDEEIRVDVPMRSIQGGPYPRLMRFYDRLGVALKLHDYSYSFSTLVPSASGHNPIITQMIYNGASGRDGVGVPSNVFRTRRLLSPLDLVTILASTLTWFFFMLALVLHYGRLYVLSRPSARTPTHLCRETLRAWADRTARQNFVSRLLGWEAFVADVIVPLFSAVCTTSIDDVWEHPAGEILDYIWLTFGTHHYVAAHGVRDIVSRLTSSIPAKNVHLDAEVRSLASDAEPGVACVGFTSSRAGNTQLQTISGFSHFILATPTLHSARLAKSFASSLPSNSTLRVPLDRAAMLLNTFCTRKVTVITHRDESVLPNHRSDWRDLNLVMDQAKASVAIRKSTQTVDPAPGCVMATHIFPTPSGPALCQTTNPIVSPASQTILSQSILDRSVLTVESKVARDSFCKPLDDGEFRWTRGDLQGLAASSEERAEAKLWLCGAWAYGGIPLLEGCVGSAEIVVQGILEEEGLKATSTI